MIFKRRDPKPALRAVAEFLWPHGGWSRAFQYVKHRMRRLPDTPEKVSRGIAAGVFAAFTPFYGIHFVIAALLARMMRGNIFAALLGTFFGNPLTYIPIGVSALAMGHWLLGRPFNAALFGFGHREPGFCGLGCRFGSAFSDIAHNFMAMFTPARADWHGLAEFYNEVFLPYMIGGIIPGIICAAVCYYLCVPLISAYQKRRRKALRNKLSQLHKKAENKGDGAGGSS